MYTHYRRRGRVLRYYRGKPHVGPATYSSHLWSITDSGGVSVEIARLGSLPSALNGCIIAIPTLAISLTQSPGERHLEWIRLAWIDYRKGADTLS